MSNLAYARSAHIGSDGRDLEAALLIKAANRLQVEADRDPASSAADDALLYNRRLWTILSAAAVEPDHPLPREIRSAVASISVFIFKQTLKAQSTPSRATFAPLIAINRDIALGLRGKA